MQIIIDIPEKVNNRLRSYLGHGYGLRDEDVKVIAEAIYNGQLEQKKGEWIRKPHVYGCVYCSLCDYELRMDNTNFCPGCGADMKNDEVK